MLRLRGARQSRRRRKLNPFQDCRFQGNRRLILIHIRLGPVAAEDLLALCREPEVLAKAAFSPFAEKKLAAHIRAKSMKHLLICGLETPICVYQTARDALKALGPLSAMTPSSCKL